MSLAFMLAALFILVFLSVPIAFALGASGLLYLLLERPNFLITFPQRIWSGTNSFVMIAMPLFILAGELMNRGGITKRLIDFCLVLVRPIRGGLGEVNVVASMIFGGISGSSVADTSALGSILIPSMIEQGYSKGFTVGVTVASSTMGMIIPPSIPMIMYSMISGASVGKLFLAGLIPGILIGISQLVIVKRLSLKHKYANLVQALDPKEISSIIKYGLFAVIMPIFIVLSVSLGIATATESAGVAVLYACLVGFLVYKQLTFADIVKALKKTVMMSSSIMIIIGFSMLYTWILAVEQIPVQIAGFVASLDIHRYWIFLFLDILLLVIGTFIDVTPALLLLCPIFIPVIKTFGMTEIQFGTVMIVGLAIGLVTPPVGMCLNVAAKISGMPITKIFKHAIPWIICNIGVLVLVTFIPEISTWIPSLIK